MEGKGEGGGEGQERGRERGRRGYLLGIVEADLTGGHGAVLFEVGPGGVDDSHIVFLIAYPPHPCQ